MMWKPRDLRERLSQSVVEADLVDGGEGASRAESNGNFSTVDSSNFTVARTRGVDCGFVLGSDMSLEKFSFAFFVRTRRPVFLQSFFCKTKEILRYENDTD